MPRRYSSSSFTIVELLATIAIAAVLIALAMFFTASYTLWARQSVDHEVYAVLNDELTRYKGNGGDLSVLTPSTPISTVFTALQTPVTPAGMPASLAQQFMANNYTFPGRSLFAAGSGEQYHIYQVDRYNDGSGGSGGSSSNAVFVQTKSVSGSNSTSNTVAYSSSQTGGDLNVVVVYAENSTSVQVLSVTDSAGNTYQQASSGTLVAGGGTYNHFIYYASNIKSGANTVTVNYSGSCGANSITVLEYSGVNTVDQISQAIDNNSDSSTATVAISTGFPKELIVSVTCEKYMASGPGAGFTARYLDVEDMIAATAGSYQATCQLSFGNEPWVILAVSFK